MKQKTIILSVITILILVSFYFAFIRKHGSYNTEKDISLKDTSTIDKIEISDSKSKLIISKPIDKWMVNENFNANNIAVKRLLRIFKNLEINIIVPENQYDSSLNLINKTGISIGFFNENSKTVYWIANYDEIKKATLIMSDDEIPVYVTAPGLTNDIRKFVETDPLFYRNKRIFDFEPEEISTIDFIDFENRLNSFQINIEDNEFQLLNFNKKTCDFDKDKILRYLSYYKNIEFESIVNDINTNATDSTLKQQSKYEIIIENKNGNKFNLKILQIKLKNTENQYDLNKAYGILNNQLPLVYINFFTIDPLIKEISYFYRESLSEKSVP